jgi:micrococcal nuclease
MPADVRYNKSVNIRHVSAMTLDNKLINLEMVRNGYAVLYTFPPNVKYVEQLREGQRYTREGRLGIWGSDGLKEMPREYRREHQR